MATEKKKRNLHIQALGGRGVIKEDEKGADSLGKIIADKQKADAAIPPPPKKKKSAKKKQVTVGTGDSLSKIAKAHNTTVKALMAANPKITNANLIRLGQKITVPEGGTSSDPYKGTSKETMAARKKDVEARRERRWKSKVTPPRSKDVMTDVISREIVAGGDFDDAQGGASGGMIGKSDMSAKKQKAPKKKKVPQYYKGGGKVKKNYAYGGRVAKYKG